MSQEGWARRLLLPGALGGSRAKSQPCEMLGLQLNHTAKTANLVLGFPLSLVPRCLPSTNRAQSWLGVLLPCGLTYHRMRDSSLCWRQGSPSAWAGVAGTLAPSLPQATAVLTSRIASLTMGLDLPLEALGHLTPRLNSLCFSTWHVCME